MGEAASELLHSAIQIPEVYGLRRHPTRVKLVLYKIRMKQCHSTKHYLQEHNDPLTRRQSHCVSSEACSQNELRSNQATRITGCSTGIGRAIAVKCAQHGAKLVLHHIGDEQSWQDIQTLKVELRSIRGSSSETINDVDLAVDVTDMEAGSR